MELQILDWIQTWHTPAGDVIMPVITSLGNAGIIWIILLVVLLIQRKKSGVILLAALLIEVVLCNGIVKNLVARTRPYDVNTAVKLLAAKPHDYSFPSGHTAASFTSVAALYWAGEKKLWKAAFVLAIAIAFSRLYLYMHDPTDVLGGILLGVLAGYLGSLAGNWICNRKVERGQ